MAFEKSALSIVAYGFDFPCVPPIAFTINMRHARGLFCNEMYYNVFRYEYLTFQTQNNISLIQILSKVNMRFFFLSVYIQDNRQT